MCGEYYIVIDCGGDEYYGDLWLLVYVCIGYEIGDYGIDDDVVWELDMELVELFGFVVFVKVCN